MIRTIKYKSGDYISINTFFEVVDNKGAIKVPVYIQVDVTKLEGTDYTRIYKASSGLFNRDLKLNLIKSEKQEKAWWKRIFKR